MNIFPISAAMAVAASMATTAAPDWRWQGTADRIDIDLVQADVRIVEAPGEPSVRIRGEGPGAGAVTFTALSAEGVTHIRDRYPDRGRWSRECLPPADERGDFWAYPIRLKVTVAVRPGTPLRIRVMRGNIHATGVGGPLDLGSGDGIVDRGR